MELGSKERSSTVKEDTNNSSLEDLALELRYMFEFYDQGRKDYPRSSGLVRGHYVWKAAKRVAEKVGYRKD